MCKFLMPWFSDCFLKHGLFSILLLSIDLSNPIVPIASLCVGSNILWGEPLWAVLALHCFICFMLPCSIIFPIAHSDTQQQGTWDWTSLICSSVRDGRRLECMAMFIIVYMLITMNCQGQSFQTYGASLHLMMSRNPILSKFYRCWTGLVVGPGDTRNRTTN